MPADPRTRALRERGAREVLADHLERTARGDVEEDIARNFSPGVVVLTHRGMLRGHQGVRVGRALSSRDRIGPVRRAARTVGRYAQVEWRAESPRGPMEGVDTYVIRDGWVVIQALHPPRVAPPRLDDRPEP
jgi:hypothetical protein